MKASVMEEVKRSFKPEFINRIDEIIVFHSLHKDVVGAILNKIIGEINSRLKDKQISLELTDKARQKVIDESFDENYGARPIRRYVTKNIETLLAKYMIEQDLKPNDILVVDVNNDNFTIRTK